MKFKALGRKKRRWMPTEVVQRGIPDLTHFEVTHKGDLRLTKGGKPNDRKHSKAKAA